jgi:hypothetical protein
LEAIRLVALRNPSLYREIHRYALSKFKEASRLYHVTTGLTRIPNLQELNDQELFSLLDQEDSRQLLHITYGYLLNAKDRNGKLSKIRSAPLIQYEEDYWSSFNTD